MDWTATKTSGGSDNGGTGTLGSFSIDNVIPFIAIAGVGLAIAGVIMAVRHRIVSGRANGGRQKQGIGGLQRNDAPAQWRESHPMGPQYGQPNPPDTQVSMWLQPITLDNGIPITGQGASVVPLELGSLPFLNGVWTPGQATLTWGTPQFDQSKYALLGYDISQQAYGPASTSAQNIPLGRVPAGTNSRGIQPFNQTYRWNTGGDTAGFRVDPVYGQITPQGQITSQFHHGGLGIRVGEPFGTFGVGP